MQNEQIHKKGRYIVYTEQDVTVKVVLENIIISCCT